MASYNRIVLMGNLTRDPQHAPFVDGVHEELTSELQRAGLPFIARQSVLQYRETDKPIAQIAQEVFPVQLNCTPSYAEYLIKKLPEEAGIEERYDAFRGDKEFFYTIERGTGNDAIVAEKGLDHLAPVFASRRNLAGDKTLSTIYGYEMDHILYYLDLNESIFSCGPLERITIDSLAELDFDLYVVVYDRDLDECPYLAAKFEGEDGLFELIHADENGRLYHLVETGD